MTNQATIRGSAIIPSLRYRDALTAIDWLVEAFGFAKHAVYLGTDNTTVQHAQLTLGTGMIMLGSAHKPGDENNSYNKLLVQPSEIGLRSTQGIYLVVADADAVYATAKAAKADIVMDIVDVSYGGRGFSCHDPEGHLWSIGTYDPWAES